MVNELKTKNPEEIDELISNGLVILDFYGEYCGPCRMQAKIFEEMDEFNILKINAEEYMGLSARFNVRSLPKIVIMNDGNICKEFNGMKTSDFIRSEINGIK